MLFDYKKNVKISDSKKENFSKAGALWKERFQREKRSFYEKNKRALRFPRRGKTGKA